ncbi:MAG: class I SAM-dependent DNA methyltransferase, partial [Epsilonproteobacteria bacterium]|nr:class I SAM-dependent DNA methyltransferase [Campylobacterota bacterium]
EIAKLRFWLSLTVDETVPCPLPNLDFKIMQGNSLLETINGFDIIPTDIYEKIVRKQTDLFGGFEEQTLFAKTLYEELSDKIHKFYNDTSGVDKKSHKEEIKSLVRQIIEEYLMREEQQYKHHEKNIVSFNSKKKKLADDMSKTLDNILIAQRILDEILSNNFQSKELFLYKLWFGEVMQDGGFDVVIGNPPYIRQEKIKELKPKLQIEGYKSYNGTADIYVYFFEQGYRLLKEGGNLSFITSNKYTRAKYGKEFRDFVLKNTDILEYIDFNGVKVFESATVDTSILSFRKFTSTSSTTFLYCDVKSDYKGEDLSDYCQKSGFLYAQNDLSIDSFSFANPTELKIKKKIEAIGTPLKEWDIKINYGIKTGFNEAFIISQEKRDELIAKDPKSAEIIKPILRGRDIKRYGYE